MAPPARLGSLIHAPRAASINTAPENPAPLGLQEFTQTFLRDAARH
jgi:hypothetical protein